MKKPLVIFGSADTAELAHYYFNVDSNYNIVAFTVDSSYIKETVFCGLPIIPFEHITQCYPPENNDIFIALGYSKLNALRAEKFYSAKKIGYHCASYISSKAAILTYRDIGENCLILENNTIQPFAKIGKNVTLWSGNHIGHHSVIGDHTFIASHVVISGRVEVGEKCFIGVNATLRDHIKIGDQCVIGAGSLLLNDADPEGVYVGLATERSSVPSKRLRWI